MRNPLPKIRKHAGLIGAMSGVISAALGLTAVALYASSLPAVTTARPRPLATVTVRPTVTIPSYTVRTGSRPVTAYRVAHALKACSGFGDRYQVPCIALYLRPEQSRTNSDGSVISNPAGPALVAECDQGLSLSELMFCLTQPSL